MASETNIESTVSFRGGNDIDLDDLIEFTDKCQEQKLPGSTRIKVNAGNDQRDGQWLHLTATEGDTVGGH